MNSQGNKPNSRTGHAAVRHRAVLGFALDETTKRLLDIVTASLGLILFAPILLIISITIKLESRGPIFVRETKYGHDNRTIRVLKFRVVMDGVEGKRMTQVGHIVHSTGIDELPQLFDVLRGGLSIVGRRNVPCFGSYSIGHQKSA